MNPLHARIQAAALRFADELFEVIEQHTSGGEWVDQNHSPLGKRKHLAAVRAGELPGVRDGKSVLVKRADLEAYLIRKAVITGAKQDADDVHGLMEEMGLPRRKAG